MTRRQLQSAHRFTLLGWLWPLARQLALLGVLVLIFSSVLDLGIEDYGLFVFTGLIAWTAFAAGLTTAADSLIRGRHLVFTPRFPSPVLPLVAVAAPLVDLLVAFPALLVMLVVEGELHVTVLLFPVLLGFQYGLTAGLALVVSATNVFFRDVTNIVSVGLLMLFYLTPVFYGVRNVPEQFQWILDVNPMAAQVGATRAVLLEGTLPAWDDLVALVIAVPAVLALGWWAFRRLEPRFVDEL